MGKKHIEDRFLPAGESCDCEDCDRLLEDALDAAAGLYDGEEKDTNK